MGGLLGSLSVKGASGTSIIDAVLSGDIDSMMYQAREKLAGVDANGNLHFEWLAQTYTPLIAGALISKFVGGQPLNLNQKLKDIPFIKI